MKNSNMALGLFALLIAYAQAALALHIGPTPIETFERPLFKSAPLVRSNSHAAQYAGRTTLASGSATQVVSTSAINSNSMIYFGIQAALAAGYASRGQITGLTSTSITGTASTTAVYSGQAILATLQTETAITSAGLSHPLRVNSIVDGVSFAVSTIDSGSLGFAAATINWHIPQAGLCGLKVNTISSAGYFIFGWEDGVAKPTDVTVMWEIRRST